MAPSVRRLLDDELDDALYDELDDELELELELIVVLLLLPDLRDVSADMPFTGVR